MLAYLSSLLWSPSVGRGVASNPALLDFRQLVAISGLSLALGLWWMAAPSDSALAFSSAEVYFLFPAPVNRRTLVQARLFSIQAMLLMQVLIWTLLLRREGGALPGACRAIGLWLLFTTVSLHRLGATLARTHAPDVPRRRPVAKIAALLFLGALAVAAILAAPRAIAVWRQYATDATSDPAVAFSRMLSARHAIQTLLDDRVVHALLWPIRVVTQPAFAANTLAWFAALPSALLVLGLHYLWILRDPQPFEELALGSSARFADRVARLRRGSTLNAADASRRHWNLALNGPPAVALVWKNVTAAIRTFRPRAILISVISLVCIVVLAGKLGVTDEASADSLRTTLSTLYFSVFAGALFTAPAWFRLDLRHDLGHLPFLKTAPLPAHTIVATEILTATLIATTAMTLFFAPPAFLVLRDIGGPLGPLGVTLVVLGGAVVVGAINLLHITLYNAIALWLPAWVPLNQGGAATGGASVVGQVYITLLGILASLSLLLAAPSAAAWGLYRVLAGSRVPISIVALIALLAALGIVTLEWLGIARLLGKALDRLEPSDIPAGNA
jgi:ABC-2 type transport system permease protein